jgi:cob(I)alamin adenosyltransferase
LSGDLSRYSNKDVRKTHLLDRTLVDKDSELIEGLGILDEANAFIGLARVFSKNEMVREYLQKVQRVIFKAGLEFVSDTKLEEEDYLDILRMIQDFERAVKKPKGFVLLEKNESGAMLSVARAVVRRAERGAVRLQKAGKVSLTLVEWLNKLSYLLYLMNLKEIEEEYSYIEFEGLEK